jgi:hypothetical protein
MPKSVIDNPIAKVELVWIRKDANEVSVIAQIGSPYRIDDLSWACPSELRGVDSQYPDMQGGSSMQAICLAIRLIKTRLGHLLDDGESIYNIADRTEKLDRAYLDIVFAS